MPCWWLLFVFLLPVRASRVATPEDAARVVRELVDRVSGGSLEEEDLYTLFEPPEAPATAPATNLEPLDRERLSAALAPTGPLGSALRERPELAAVQVGPDYTRVVLATDPHLSFVVVRRGGRVCIRRWEITRCASCSEPERFVTDLVADVQEGRARRLVPGLDLDPDAAVEPGPSPPTGETAPPPLPEPGTEARTRWLSAWYIRNQNAGFLRYFLHGARVLGTDLAGVRVELRNRVETWPVHYEAGRWMLDYAGLPLDSGLRLHPEEHRRWRFDASFVRQKAAQWWLPYLHPLSGGGVLLSEQAVGVGYDPIHDRWLLALQRADRRLALLAGLDTDGQVTLRVPLPSWPARVPIPVPDTTAAWRFQPSPAGDRVFLAGAGRWWLVRVEDGRATAGPRGLLGRLRAVDWSPDGRHVAVGDGNGNVALVDTATAAYGEIRYTDSGSAGAPVAGLAFFAGGTRLVVAWRDGTLRELRVPDLEVESSSDSLCCGQVESLQLQPRLGRVLLGCGPACTPVSLAVLPLSAPGGETRVGDVRLSGLPIGSPPLQGRWTVLGYHGQEGRVALCTARDLTPQAMFGTEVPLGAAWNQDASHVVILDRQGRAVLWPVETLLSDSRTGR